VWSEAQDRRPQEPQEPQEPQPQEEWSQGVFAVSAEELAIQAPDPVVLRIQCEATSMLQQIGQPVQAIEEESKRKGVRGRNSEERHSSQWGERFNLQSRGGSKSYSDREVSMNDALTDSPNFSQIFFERSAFSVQRSPFKKSTVRSEAGPGKYRPVKS
jgi:hypothetical protein